MILPAEEYVVLTQCIFFFNNESPLLCHEINIITPSVLNYFFPMLERF